MEFIAWADTSGTHAVQDEVGVGNAVFVREYDADPELLALPLGLALELALCDDVAVLCDVREDVCVWAADGVVDGVGAPLVVGRTVNDAVRDGVTEGDGDAVSDGDEDAEDDAEGVGRHA